MHFKIFFSEHQLKSHTEKGMHSCERAKNHKDADCQFLSLSACFQYHKFSLKTYLLQMKVITALSKKHLCIFLPGLQVEECHNFEKLIK